MKTVILTKLEEAANPVHPKNKAVGTVREGEFTDKPVVGKEFYIGRGFRSYKTSTVQEILSENTFRTYNSIYKWELIEFENFDK